MNDHLAEYVDQKNNDFFTNSMFAGKLKVYITHTVHLP